MGWAFLPPIQRTLAPPIAPVTRPVEVPGELSAWRSPAFTDSLSHAVVDTSSGGVIDGDGGGLGHPTNTSVPAPELTLLPPPRPTAVQRSVRPGAAARAPPRPSRSDEVRPPLRRSPGHRRPGCRSSTAPSSTTRPGPDRCRNLVPEPASVPSRWSSPWRPSPSTGARPRPTPRRPTAPVDQVRAAARACVGAGTGAVGGGGRARDGATQRGRAPGSDSYIHAVGDTGR